MLWLNFWREKTSEKLSSKFHNLNQNSDCMYWLVILFILNEFKSIYLSLSFVSNLT
jgi:hypothetical protein